MTEPEYVRRHVASILAMLEELEGLRAENARLRDELKRCREQQDAALLAGQKNIVYMLRELLERHYGGAVHGK